MPNTRRSLLLCFLLVLLPPIIAVRAADIAPKDRIVVLISIDGLPAFSLADPRVPAPTLKKLMAEGAFANRMQVVNPSVTWPNHTAMVTGVTPANHGVLFNGMLLSTPGKPPRVEPWRDKVEMVRAKTIYDVAHQAGLTTAQVDWVAIYNAPTINWQFAERPSPSGAVEKEMVAEGLLTQADVEQFNRSTSGAWRDVVWTQAAAHIIRRHKPNLLLFHLLNLDSIHHSYGPRTAAGSTGISLADARVRDLLNALEAAGMKDRATILIASDHGFKQVRRSIRPNAALRKAGLVRGEGANIECDAWVVPEGGTAMLFLTSAAGSAALPQLKRLLGELPGVDRVIEPPGYAVLGLPSPEKNPQMAALVLAAKEGYAFSGSSDGEPVDETPSAAPTGTHGYVSTDPDMDAVFVAWGYGIRPGARLDSVRNLDIAPTIAALLGLKLGGVEGRELREILK